jgi:predicted DNA-binding transcriptional regulator AlpA
VTDEPYWNTSQAAEYLGVSAATLADWRSERRGPPYVHLGGASNAPVRYRPEKVRQWALDQERRHTEAA